MFPIPLWDIMRKEIQDPRGRQRASPGAGGGGDQGELST